MLVKSSYRLAHILHSGEILTRSSCSNVVAATDVTLLALAGIGMRHGKVHFTL